MAFSLRPDNYDSALAEVKALREIHKRLLAENTALRQESVVLKGQVAQLEEKVKWAMADRNVATQAFKSKDEQFEFVCDEVDTLKEQLSTLQSKSAALVDALEDCKAWLNRNGYHMQAHEAEAALAAFKGKK